MADPSAPSRSLPSGHDTPVVPAEDFRSFMRGHYAGVAVVTSRDAFGEYHGLTCNSVTSVTLSPPTLLVSLHLDSGTLDAVRASSGFVVNLLHSGGRGCAELFSSPSTGRFERVPWRPSPVLALPHLVEDAGSFAECRVSDTMAVGDHALVLGHVITAVEGAAPPLLYGGRGYVAETAPLGSG